MASSSIFRDGLLAGRTALVTGGGTNLGRGGGAARPPSFTPAARA
jgi:hypothetical protein